MGKKPNKLKFVVDAEGKEIPAKEPSSYIKAKIEYNALLNAFNELKDKSAVIDTKETDELKAEIERLKAIKPKTETKTEIKEIEKIVNVPIELKENEFIMELSEDLAPKINTAIDYLKKEGSLNGIEPKDYLNVFTELSYKFILKNYFSKVL